MTESEYEEIKATTLAALANDERDVAFQTLRHALNYNSDVMAGDVELFADAMTVFARVSQEFGNNEFSARVAKVAKHPEDVQCLYDLGYALYEESLFGIAAAVLTRADQLAPAQPGIVSELVCALEGDGRNREAVRILSGYPNLTSEHYLFAYLLSFNQLMAGNLTEAEAASKALEGLETEDAHPLMTARINGFLNRASKIKHASPLDEHDLRGWHYVASGSILTTLSPYGFPEPMNGRFGYLQDSFASCKKGLENLQRIVRLKSVSPACIFSLPGRDSEILSIAASKFFNLPLEPWPNKRTDRPGIIVAYDIGEVDLAPESLAHHHSDQLLYSHALQWTFALPVAPDVTTLMHQMIVAPWGATTGFDAETNQMTSNAPDDRAPAEIAEEILAATSDEDSPLADDEEQPPALSDDFIKAVGDFPLSSSLREQIWTCSPVKSAKFN
jgi:hypothetical protein